MPSRPDLLALARAAALRAHAPYSGFHVGCVVESVDGEVATGANVENACYRLGLCAEQAALAAAQLAFGLDKVARIVVSGGSLREGAMHGEALAGHDPVMPCGGCRQAIHEAAVMAERDIEVICTAATGDESIETTIAALLPAAFGPGVLRG